MSQAIIKRVKNSDPIIDLSMLEDWEQCYQDFKELIDAKKQFWAGSTLVLKLPELPAFQVNLEQLQEFTGEYQINISAVLTESKELQIALRRAGYQIEITGKYTSHVHKVTKSEIENRLPANAFEARTAYIVADDNKALRSGQKLVYDGNLIILGDANSGSEIYATGSIVVYGRLTGKVHAGWKIEDAVALSEIFIKALKVVEPVQVSIGPHTACSIEEPAPEDSKESEKRSIFKKKKPVEIEEQYILETYRVIEGEIWRLTDQQPKGVQL